MLDYKYNILHKSILLNMEEMRITNIRASINKNKITRHVPEGKSTGQWKEDKYKTIKPRK